MDLQKATSFVSRVFFIVSLVLLVVAGVERVCNVFGYTILVNTEYTAGRLLEFSALLLVFVIAMLMRQVRDELRRPKA